MDPTVAEGIFEILLSHQRLEGHKTWPLRVAWQKSWIRRSMSVWSSCESWGKMLAMVSWKRSMLSQFSFWRCCNDVVMMFSCFFLICFGRIPFQITVERMFSKSAISLLGLSPCARCVRTYSLSGCCRIFETGSKKTRGCKAYGSLQYYSTITDFQLCNSLLLHC